LSWPIAINWLTDAFINDGLSGKILPSSNYWSNISLTNDKVIQGTECGFQLVTLDSYVLPNTEMIVAQSGPLASLTIYDAE
jgi:hypothetical protein